MAAAVGEPVIAYVFPLGPPGGSYAELVVVPEASVVPAPKGFRLAEAATLLLNGATARLALDALSLAAGAAVAIVGGAGAVGAYAVQLAKLDGVVVITDASPEDDSFVRSLGADIVVRRSADVAAAIRSEFPAGVPGLIDAATLDAAVLPAIADGGGLVTLKGWTGQSERGIEIHPISSFGSATDTALFDRLRKLAEEHVLTLRVAAVLPAARAAEAHRRLAAGGVRGRIVLNFTAPLQSD